MSGLQGSIATPFSIASNGDRIGLRTAASFTLDTGANIDLRAGTSARLQASTELDVRAGGTLVINGPIVQIN